MSYFRTLALTGAFVFLMTALAGAQVASPNPPFVFFPIDRTIATPSSFSFGTGSLIVGFERFMNGEFINPSSPTITFVAPVTSLSPLYLYHGSTVVVDHATLRNVYQMDDSTLILNNDAVANNINLIDRSELIFNGGIVNNASAYDSSRITMSGGQVGNESTNSGVLDASNNSSVTATNGAIFGSARARGDGSLNLVSSTVSTQVGAEGNSGTVAVVSSFIGREASPGGYLLVAQNRGKLFADSSTIYGGAFAGQNSEIGISNCTFQFHLLALDDSEMAISGSSVTGGGVLSSGRATIIMTDNVNIDGAVTAQEASTIFMDHGSAESLEVLNNGVVGLTNSIIFDGVQTSGNGTLNLSGKTSVGGSLTAQDDSRVNFDDSFVHGDVFAVHRSVITISNFSFFDGNVTALSNASIIMSSGIIQRSLVSLSDSVVQLIGGGADEGISSGSGNFIMSGGSISQNLTASFFGTVNLFGGRVDGDLVVTDNATTNMAGGFVGGTLQLSGNGVFNYSGGTFGQGVPPVPDGGGGSLSLLSEDSSAGQGAGGLLGPGLIGYDSSTINLFGPDITATLIDPNFEGMFSVYEMTGNLADGTPIGGEFLYIQNETGASFHIFLVPEPSGFALACIALIGGLLRRSR